jgi:hypothetical protein
MLQLCENFFADAVLVEFGLNGGNDFVYNRAVDARLKNVSLSYSTLWMSPATIDTASLE